MTTNAEFSVIAADQFEKLVSGVYTEAQFAAAFKTALDDWSGAAITKQEIALQIANLLQKIGLREAQIITWYGGAADGGWDASGTTPGGGYYPFTLPDGSTVYRISPAKMLSVTQKGDSAKNDISLSASYGIGAKEIIGGYIAAYPASFSAANSKAYARKAPTNIAVINIKKNMTAATTDPDTWPNWGTITWAAGANVATVAIPTPTLIAGDFLDFVAPSVQDPTLNDVRLTIAGV